MNEYYGAPTTSTEDFLAHYGVRGMKWGVRKAIQSGNDRALARQYRKAERKLKKLEKLGSNGKKYAKRAAAYGAGAAAAGGLALAGTSGVGSAVRGIGRVGGKAMRGVGKAVEGAGRGLLDSRKHAGIGTALMRAGHGMSTAGGKVSGKTNAGAHAIEEWGRSTGISDKLRSKIARPGGGGTSPSLAARAHSRLNGVSNDTIARIGAGAVGAGLGIASARNAYKAATAKKHAQQAKQFRAEMNKAFAGTKYANGRPTSTSKKRRGSRRG